MHRYAVTHTDTYTYTYTYTNLFQQDAPNAFESNAFSSIPAADEQQPTPSEGVSVPARQETSPPAAAVQGWDSSFLPAAGGGQPDSNVDPAAPVAPPPRKSAVAVEEARANSITALSARAGMSPPRGFLAPKPSDPEKETAADKDTVC